MITQLFAYGGAPSGGASQGASGGNPMSLIFMIVAIFAVMYFLMIRPQQRQKRQQQDMLSKISKGDKVVTIGGIHGTVAGVKGNTVILKIADNVKIEVNRSSISQVLESRTSRAQSSSQSVKSQPKEREDTQGSAEESSDEKSS